MRAKITPYFDSEAAMNKDRPFWNTSVSLTPEVDTADEALKAAEAVVDKWTNQNPYSNLGWVVGVLRTNGKFRGGYQTMWSST